MKSKLFFGRALAGIGVACAVAISFPFILQAVAGSVAYADEKDGIRPEFEKPLQAAKQALDAKKFGEALADLKRADEIPGQSPNEKHVLEQLRLVAAIGAQEPATAAKAFDTLEEAPGLLTPKQRSVFAQSIAKGYFQAKEYQAAATWIGRYFQTGGSELSMHSLLAQVYYSNNDFANCIKASNVAIDAYEKAGLQAPETVYQLLVICVTKQNDKNAYFVALERLTSAYPKPEYWADLVHMVITKPGFPDSRLGLDILRLQAATGELTNATQYVEFAELAIQAGLPAEAKAALDKGYAAAVLGTGPEAERHSRLREMAKRAVEVDQPTLSKTETEAEKQPTGNALVAAGLNIYGYGQYDKAITLIQAGIAKGGLKYPDDAKLHLGIVEISAGKKADGVATLKSIRSGDAVSEIAGLWMIKAYLRDKS